MKWLAKNISYNEMIFSQIAARHNIDNNPDDAIKDNLAKTALALQVIRASFHRPAVVSSGYRCEELNKKIGGSEKSHHTLGLAVDFTIPGISIDKIVQVIPGLIEFDQLINEYDQWVHLSIHPGLRNQIIKV